MKAPFATVVVNVRTSVSLLSRTRATIFPDSDVVPLIESVSRTASPFGENHGVVSAVAAMPDRVGPVVSTRTVPDFVTGVGAFSQASWPVNV